MSADRRNIADDLRKRAETLLAKSPGTFKPADISNVNRLSHELAVHQAELELQNEELRNTQLALQKARDRFAALFEHAPVGYVVLDGSGIIRRTNATWRTMLNRPDVDFRGMPFTEALLEEDSPVFLSRFRAFFRNPEEKRIVLRIKRNNAPPFHAQIEAKPSDTAPEDGDSDASPRELMVIVSDITPLNQARREVETRNDELSRTNDRLDHIYRVLLGIRKVNQLIVTEDDPGRLIELACVNLTGKMGYFNAWIALVGGEAALELGLPGRGGVSAAASAGFDGGFGALRERLERGEFPSCMSRALESEEMIVSGDPTSDCPDCPLSAEYGGRAALARRLAFNGVTYGILTASVPAAYADNIEEQNLFDEVADDLSFALHKIATARKLEESRRRYREIFSHSRDGFVMVDKAGSIIDANDAFCDMLGYTPDELRALADFYEITPERWRGWESTEIWEKRLLSRGHSGLYEKEYIRKDGTVFPVELSAYTVRLANGEIDYLWGTARDITERKQAEKKLIESEARFRSFVENANDIVYTLTPEGLFTYVSPNWKDLMGEPADSAIGKSFEAYVHPEDVHLCREFLQRALTTREKQSSVEYRVRHRDGTWRWHDSNGSPLLDANGTVSAYLGIARDITEHKERDLEYARILKAAIDGFWIIDMEGNLLEVNDAAAALLGYSRQEMTRLTINDIDAEEKPEETRLRIRKVLDEGSARFETLHKRKDGSLVEVEVSVSFSPMGGGRMVTFTRDISERKRTEREKELLQAQLTQAHKMESVGRLAGGVAHDFNNMLGIILGHTDMALEYLDPGQPVHSDLTEIRKATMRSADLVRQLLAFARKQTIAPKVLDLNDTVEGMLKMLRRLIGENIDLSWMPGKNLWPVNMDPTQIDQILANLCVNARDAIDGVGKVTIETGNATLDEADCKKHLESVPGDYVLLAVSDDGCGMEKEILDRLFEPFFTTKEVGKGTGLGLPMIYGIVKQNEGFINVYSEPGRGTTFRIYIPRHIGEAKKEQRQASDETIRGGDETILLVEDEPMLLQMGSAMLEKLGYRVLAAGSPSEALRIAAEHKEDIRLLITDVIMPGMNGREMADRLSEICPGMKLMFMSGYTADTISHHGVLDPGVKFVQKPFSMKDLANRIREALES